MTHELNTGEAAWQILGGDPALYRPKLRSVECDRCDRGTFLVRGKTRYEARALRCAFCRGTGRVLVPVEQ